MNPEKRVDAAKNIGRDGTGKRDDESQQDINEPPTVLPAKGNDETSFKK
jgi:hypothetical protein